MKNLICVSSMILYSYCRAENFLAQKNAVMKANFVEKKIISRIYLSHYNVLIVSITIINHHYSITWSHVTIPNGNKTKIYTITAHNILYISPCFPVQRTSKPPILSATKMYNIIIVYVEWLFFFSPSVYDDDQDADVFRHMETKITIRPSQRSVYTGTRSFFGIVYTCFWNQILKHIFFPTSDYFFFLA